MYVLVSQLLKADAVGEGFAARLEGEGSVHVAQGESLSVHGADWQAPEIIAVLKTKVSVSANFQLWYIALANWGM